MTRPIGIRRETKSEAERRAPLTPEHVRRLVEAGQRVLVQPSATRVFPDAAYAAAGAGLSEDLSACGAIFGVKEVPLDDLLPGKTYVFFSHTLKGQPYNMPMLARLLSLGCRLVDYELMADDAGKRLVFFGRYAGYAGMIDTLAGLGRRLSARGLATPFAPLEMAHGYPSLAVAKDALRAAGEAIARDGLPEAIAPLVVGFAGYGNVAVGAMEVLGCLPVEHLTPEALLATPPEALSRRCVHQVVFREADLVSPLDPERPFELAHYYAHPEAYVGRFADYLPRLSVLMNCLYWEPRYPRLITRADARALWAGGAHPRLEVIGDLGCDLGGPVEFTVKATTQASPAFVYEPAADAIREGWDGQGPAVLAVDNLPTELPLEASTAFGDALMPFVAAIGAADPAAPYTDAALPAAIARAVITDQGRLTPPYAYLEASLQEGMIR